MTERDPTRQPRPSSPRPLCHSRAPSVISATRPSFAHPLPSSPSPPSVIPAKAGIHPRIPRVIPALFPSLASGRGVERFPDTSASGITNLKTDGWIPVFTGMTERDPTRQPRPSSPRPLCHSRAPSVISAPLVSSPRPLCHSRAPSVISATRPSFACPVRHPRAPPSVIPAKAGIHPRIPRVIPVLPPSLASSRGVERFPDTSAPGLTNLKTDGWIPVFTGMTERDPTRQPRPSSPRPLCHSRVPSVISAPLVSFACPVRHLRAPCVISVPSFSHSRESGNPSPHPSCHSRPSSVPCVGQGS